MAAWKLVSNDAKRKAHSRTAKCEAFHFASRLFFYVFVSDYIHDSAIMQNRFFVRGICYGVRDWVRISMRRGRA